MIQKNWFSTVSIISAMLIVILLGLTIGRCLFAFSHNRITTYYVDVGHLQYQDNGIPNEYKRGVPVHEIEDLSKFLPYATIESNIDENAYSRLLATTDSELGKESDYITVTLKDELNYYSFSNSEKTLVYAIPKGTEIIILPYWEQHIEYGYGFISFPTYEKNLRYAKAFLRADLITDTTNKDLSEGIEAQPYYYVELSDLEEISNEIYDSSTNYETSTLKSFPKEKIPLWIDSYMYAAGIYCSPDIYHPYFDTTNIVLLSAAGTAMAVLAVVKAHDRRKA